MSRRLAFALWVVVCGSCAGPKSNGKPGPEGAPSPPVDGVTRIDTDDPGLTFKLKEGAEGGRVDRVSVAPAQPLDAATAQKILARLPAIAAEATDQKEFAMREKSLAAPRTGKTVATPFPPPPSQAGAEQPTSGPLEVTRSLPEGPVPLAPHVSVTFSQPMVPVTSLAELEKRPVPVKLTPQPKGRWRWVGAKTLLFEPESLEPESGEVTPGRMPMATEYTVEIPAGTQPEIGTPLVKGVSFKFKTPPPALQGFHPYAGQPTVRDPILFASFDQHINPDAVLASIKLMAGDDKVPVRLAKESEWKEDETVSNLVQNARPGRWLAFRPAETLPADSYISVAIGPGTPSAEGPLKTEAAEERTFRTYGPMRIDWQNCDDKAHGCTPSSALIARFTNPIDVEKFDQAMITVSPPIEGMKVATYGNQLSIHGRLKGNRSYEVKFAGSIPDSFGQTMGKDDRQTYVIGSAPPSLYSPAQDLLVLDPAVGPKFSVFTVNHKSVRLKAFEVGPGTWDAYGKYRREQFHRETYPPEPPGKRLVDDVIPIKGEADELVETRIDLAKVMGKSSGQVIVWVEPTARPKNRWDWQPIVTWVQATQLGVDAIVDDDELVAWATSLKDGKPIAGVELEIAPMGVKATTGADGIARMPLGDGRGRLLVARKGGDLAILPEQVGWWNENGGWQKASSPEMLRWYGATDRGMYKPKEEVRYKGFLRRITPGEMGDVAGLGTAGGTVSYTVIDARGNEVAKGSAKPSALGGFDLSFKLPDAMNLGPARIQLVSDRGGDGSSFTAGFQVQEFRRPEFEVSARAEEGPHFVGTRANIAVEAKYYAGGGLANAETTWNVSSSPGFFTPPNRSEWTFGYQPSWWDSYGSPGRGRSRPARRGRPSPVEKTEHRSESYKATTDSSGKHVLRIDFQAVNPPRATSVVAQATVMDVNRQAWGASATLLVHPAKLYVGLKPLRAFVDKGQPIKVDALVTDLDGKAIAGRAVEVTAVRLEWEQKKGEMKLEERDPEVCKITSKDGGERCTFTPKTGGMHRLTALVVDDEGRKNQTQLSIWVAGGKIPAAREVEQEQVRLLLDKKKYAPGDTAEVLVIAPWGPAEGLLTLQRQGVFRVQRFTTDAAGQTTLTVKIEEGWTPNAIVRVDVVGSAPRVDDSGDVDEKQPRRPAFASGQETLIVESPLRRLALTATPRLGAMEPGGQTTVDVQLKDASGQPVAGGEVALIIVDEAILALSGYQLADPIGTFYQLRGAGARDHHLRGLVVLANPDDARRAEPEASAKEMMMDGRASGGAPGAPPPAPSPVMRAAKPSDAPSANQPVEATPITVRSDFNPLALFAPTVTTDAQGRAQVPVKLPDNLTRYRVMAIAASGENRFGKGESTITARLPLMVRPSAPRFLNFGDELELPVVLQNQTDKPMEVQLAVRATNAELTAGNGRIATVPANDRIEVRFPAAARKAGIARFQMAAVSGKWSDAAEVELPVWTPATTEAFATYGVVDNGAIAQPVQMPAGVFPQFGGLEVTTSSTALQALTDALLYLARYPYECSEQMSSRILAVAALRDVLTAFQAEGLPPPAELERSMAKDLELLRRLQNGDGGWGFWKRGERSWPFLTAHVAHALARAKQKGYKIPDGTIERALPYLKQIERHIPAEWGPEVRRAIVAYALYVRLKLGDRDAAKAREIFGEVALDKLGMETIAWLYPVLTGDQGSTTQIAAIRKHLANRVEETAGAAHFVTGYGDGAYLLLHSDRRVDGLLLEGLIGDQPKSDLIPKLVEGLLAHRTAGRWANTQESAWVLLALDLYFRTYEKVTPNFVARVWLGDQYAGEHAFRGRTTERHFIGIPMQWLANMKQATSNLVIGKDGPGRMYYRVGMQYAPTDLKMPPRDNGFTVERKYEAVDDPKDVTRDADGTWKVKAGARVRVRLTMVAQARRYHVALVDPLPAGLEPLNPALKVTGNLPVDEQAKPMSGGRRWWWGPWYEHDNMRDERVEAFTSLLWEGVHEYSYVARATTPGKFVVPPTKAEEMYHPETFGRAAGDKLWVE
jgi:alpha-2-macroglobulin